MGQNNSKDEMVHAQVIEGNAEAIKALCNEGARLEWIDKEGKTPLIVACMDARLYIVAKTLIELGANVNAYRPGAHCGTPLHHAAKRGLHHTVKLLLSHGANPFARNDDCQTPLEVARAKGNLTVVRAIEAHICYYSGDIHEMLIPRVVGSLISQSLARKSSKKCYVVVVPLDSPNTRKPPKLELAVYSSPQDAQPHIVIPLWKSNIAEPKFHESDPSFTILNESTRTSYKFLSAIEGDKQQVVQLYSACKGAPKVMPFSELSITGVSPSQPEAVTSNQPEFTSGSNSQPSTTTNGWGDFEGHSTPHSKTGSSHVPPPSKATYNGWTDALETEECNGWANPGSSKLTVDPTPVTLAPVPSSPSHVPPPSKATYNGWGDALETEECNGWVDPGSSKLTVGPTPVTLAPVPSAPPAPSAPPLPMDVIDDEPIHYPAVDVHPVDVSLTSGGSSGKTDESCCVVCWDAPVEGACVPCGHMAGCMSCLMEIKFKQGDCPVCRAKIDQVIRLYAV